MKILLTIFPIFLALGGLAIAQSPYVMAPQTNPPPPWTPPSSKLPADLRHFLENADEFTLYSLNPELDFPHKAPNIFHYYPILGQVRIETGIERTNLVTVLSNAIAEGGPMADCFDPRHGIRAKRDGETVDFIICFECGAINAFSSKGTNWIFPVSGSASALFNQTLQKAGVPLPTN
jgi:hypothetical protein